MIEKILPFKDRLKRALNEKELRPVDLCSKTGISQSTMSQYLSGYAEPKKERLSIIANALDINPTWLMGLDVPMDPIASIDVFNEETQKIFDQMDAFEAQLKALGWTYELKGCNTWDLIENAGLGLDDEGNMVDGAKGRPTGCEADGVSRKCDTCENRHSHYLLSNGSVSFIILVENFNSLREDTQAFIKKKLQKLLQESFDEPLLNAANERTDIEVTDKMKKNDNDIMNDDREWE